jgi:hypothetical protein
MKPELTKTDGLYILQYYNIQIPKNDKKIIQDANKYIEQNLCKCIKNKHTIKDELNSKKKCNVYFQKTKKHKK